MIFGKNKKRAEFRPPVTPEMSPATAAILDKITVNEQSSIRVDAGEILYFDPFRIKGSPSDADLIFITHSHYDHLSPEDIEKVRKDGTVFVIPVSLRGDLSKLGIGDPRIAALEPGGEADVSGIHVEAVPAYNKMKPFHPRRNGWLGYTVTAGGVRIYVAGDTDATDEAKKVKCDVAILPIGGTYTMNAKEARELASLIAPQAAIPTHYGSIVGSPSDYDEFARGPGIAVKKLHFK